MKKSIESSAFFTLLGVAMLLLLAVTVTVTMPSYLDPSWTEASNPYQQQMYEDADPNTYINVSAQGEQDLRQVRHLQKGKDFFAFVESPLLRITASPSLEPYISRFPHEQLILTQRLLLLRKSHHQQTEKLQQKLQKQWKIEHPHAKHFPHFEIYELYEPKNLSSREFFVRDDSDPILDNWVDENYQVIDSKDLPPRGLLYVKNPRLYPYQKDAQSWSYSPSGKNISDTQELADLGFISRKQLIAQGEDIFRNEGCWYCHTDQSRTLIQDCVLNGSASYPAPPSSAHEYIYQEVSFPGTRRIGPDLARVGIKRPNRDWHIAHFWSPESKSKGSIMPAFRHFFLDNPSGSSRELQHKPSLHFEAIYQYLMTKGTRINVPSQAWWLGKDHKNTLAIIEQGDSHDR